MKTSPSPQALPLQNISFTVLFMVIMTRKSVVRHYFTVSTHNTGRDLWREAVQMKLLPKITWQELTIVGGNLYTKSIHAYLLIYTFTVRTLESVSYLPVLRAIGETSVISAV